jgi:predicted DNA-binding protein
VSAGTKIFTVRLSEDLRKACREKSERTGRDLASVIRERLEEWVNEPDEAEFRGEKTA